MTKRKPKPEPAPPVVFDQAMLDRAYEAAMAHIPKKSFTADPKGLLIVVLEAALQQKFQGGPH